MEIEYYQNKIVFLEVIDTGACFRWNSQLFIKTSRCIDDETILCVRLTDGYAMDFNICDEVELVSNIKIVVGG